MIRTLPFVPLGMFLAVLYGVSSPGQAPCSIDETSPACLARLQADAEASLAKKKHAGGGIMYFIVGRELSDVWEDFEITNRGTVPADVLIQQFDSDGMLFASVLKKIPAAQKTSVRIEIPNDVTRVSWVKTVSTSPQVSVRGSYQRLEGNTLRQLPITAKNPLRLLTIAEEIPFGATVLIFVNIGPNPLTMNWCIEATPGCAGQAVTVRPNAMYIRTIDSRKRHLELQKDDSPFLIGAFNYRMGSLRKFETGSVITFDPVK
jgi:hypothetical protein